MATRPPRGYVGSAEIVVKRSRFIATVARVDSEDAARAVIAGVRAAKQYLTYVGGAPFQPAVAQALDEEDGWSLALRDTFEARRNRLAAALTDIGFVVHDSHGTYFLCADPRPLGYTDSTTFCAELPGRAGVAAIPMSAFTSADNGWNHLVRFAFCKRDDTMDEAIRRLGVLKSH